MWMERYFQKLPKGAHLVPVRLRPPSPKRPKRGPGRPRKVQTPPAPAPLVLDDSDRSTSDLILTIPLMMKITVASPLMQQ